VGAFATLADEHHVFTTLDSAVEHARTHANRHIGGDGFTPVAAPQ
jgi:hypothetical protein